MKNFIALVLLTFSFASFSAPKNSYPFQLSCQMRYLKYVSMDDDFNLEESADDALFDLGLQNYSGQDSDETQRSFKGFKLSVRKNNKECFEADSKCFLNIKLEKGDSSSWNVVPVKSNMKPKFYRFSLRKGLELVHVVCGYSKDM